MSPSLLAWVPGFPLLGAVINGILGPRVSRGVSGAVACTAVGLSALLSAFALFAVHAGGPVVQVLYPWIDAGRVHAGVGLLADPLSTSMMCVVTGVGFLIHVYSVGYMDGPSDRRSVYRYFAWLNLFIFAMLLLVMADNLLLMFVGWEGVGLCSYLLIGFWFGDTANAIAGKKAFVTNRVGDFCFILGMFWLFWSLGPHATFDFTKLQEAVVAHPALLGGTGGLAVTGVCMLLFGGATGKSAQIPLYVWLPDAMAGPTPVSALIHAATMVTAGVYMVCRLGFLYAMAPAAMGLVALVGALTAFFAATIAVTQNDIKKVLAYSTISQIGYMFLGVGVGAFAAGFFHVVTHAFFKALLFLGAGSIIHAMHHQQDMRFMGGLRRRMPVTFWSMTAAYLAIIGFPGFSGFFSKDEILWRAWSAAPENVALFGDAVALPRLLWALGFLAAGLTAFYMTRLYLMTFFGEYRGGGHQPHESPAVMAVPLAVLGVLSTLGGVFDLPHWLPGSGALDRFLEPVFEHAVPAAAAAEAGSGQELFTMLATLALVAVGAGVAWTVYAAPTPSPDPLAARAGTLWRGSSHKWYVDEIYEASVLRPILLVARHLLWAVVDVLFIDGLVNGVAATARGIGRWYGRRVQVGRPQGYALGIAGGAMLLVLLYAIG